MTDETIEQINAPEPIGDHPSEASALPLWGVHFTGTPEAQAKFAEEYAAAMGEFTTAEKDTSGQVGNKTFNYADLASILRATRPALSKHGIALFTPLAMDRRHVPVVTVLLVGHGATLQASLEVPELDGNLGAIESIKLAGALVTYSRRYALQSLLGIAGDTDADDHPASPPGARNAPPPPQNRPQGAPQGGPPKSAQYGGKPATAARGKPAAAAPRREDPPAQQSLPQGEPERHPVQETAQRLADQEAQRRATEDAQRRPPTQPPPPPFADDEPEDPRGAVPLSQETKKAINAAARERQIGQAALNAHAQEELGVDLIVTNAQGNPQYNQELSELDGARMLDRIRSL